MTGARIFVAIVFVVLGAAFLASTGLLIVEFQELDWLTMLVAHSHLFLFFPSFGLLALIAFYLPSIVLTHLCWTHLPYGKARFVIGVLVLAGLAYLFAGSLDKEPRAIYEVAPFALAADRGDQAAGRVAILDALGTLRKTAQQRFGLSSFGRSCVRDPMLEVPDEYLKERYCFPAKKNLNGAGVLRRAGRVLQGRVASAGATRRPARSRPTWTACCSCRSRSFFILIVVAIGLLLAYLAQPHRPALRRHGRQPGARHHHRRLRHAVLAGHGLRLPADRQRAVRALPDGAAAPPQPGASRRGRCCCCSTSCAASASRARLIGQISGVVVAGVAVLRYEQLNDWAVRLFGIGSRRGSSLAVLVAIPAVGLVALYWFRHAGIYGRRSASSA